MRPHHLHTRSPCNQATSLGSLFHRMATKITITPPYLTLTITPTTDTADVTGLLRIQTVHLSLVRPSPPPTPPPSPLPPRSSPLIPCSPSSCASTLSESSRKHTRKKEKAESADEGRKGEDGCVSGLWTWRTYITLGTPKEPRTSLGVTIPPDYCQYPEQIFTNGPDLVLAWKKRGAQSEGERGCRCELEMAEGEDVRRYYSAQKGRGSCASFCREKPVAGRVVYVPDAKAYEPSGRVVMSEAGSGTPSRISLAPVAGEESIIASAVDGSERTSPESSGPNGGSKTPEREGNTPTGIVSSSNTSRESISPASTTSRINRGFFSSRHRNSSMSNEPVFPTPNRSTSYTTSTSSPSSTSSSQNRW